jgi:hypothetical protein
MILVAFLSTLALPAMVHAGSPVSLHFLHPISVPSDPENVSTVRLSLLYGRSASVRALDLGLIAGRTSGDMQGLQLQGFYAGTGGDLRGVSATFGVNLVQQEMRGVQIGALANWVQDSVTGVQGSGILNYANAGVAGAQLSSFLNISDGPTRFAQVSGVANVAVGDVRGLQLTGFVNHANARMSGAQVAVLNHADVGSGLQLGIINLARDMTGLQFGAINVSREISGVPIGLINHSTGNPRHWLLYASSLSAANLAYRTEVNGWVSTLSGGYGDLQGSQEEAGFLSWHFGHRLLGSGRTWLGVDVGLVHIMPVKHDDPAVNDRLHRAVQLRLTGDLAVGSWLNLWGAVGVSSIAESYEDEAATKDELLVAGGVVIR